MRKSFIKVMFFGALALSTATYVGCKDYDDDISNLQEQIDANKAGIAELKQKVDNGNWVKSVEQIPGGFKVTFNDNKSYEIVSGKDGAAGVAGKDGTIVTINEDGIWCIDGKPTEYSAVVKDGVDGKSPFIKDGFWYFYQPTNAGAITEGELKGWVKGDATTGTADIYVVQEAGRPCYTLHAKDKETGEWLSTPLPNAMKISSMAVVSIDADNKLIEGMVDVPLYYGTVSTDIDFGPTGNKKHYTKGQTLVSNSEIIHALINPTSVDFTSASKYTIGLTDSKGNTDFVVTGIKQNMTEGALTRAAEATPNKGIFDLTVALVPGFDADKFDAATANKKAYALTTTDAWGQEIISKYDVKIAADGTTHPALTNVVVAKAQPINASVNMDELFNQAAITASTNTLNSVVAHYYELKNLSNTVTITDNTITATKPEAGVVVNVIYLRTNGVQETKTLTITFMNIVAESTIPAAEWTVNKEVNPEAKDKVAKVYVGDALNRELIKFFIDYNGMGVVEAQDATTLAGANADGKVVVNEGEAAVGRQNNDVTFSIAQDPADKKFYATATFDASKVIATTYNVVLNLTKDGLAVDATASNLLKTLNWQIAVKQDNSKLFNLKDKRKAELFDGNNAWAAGASVSANQSEYDLLNLYADATTINTNFTYTEKVPVNPSVDGQPEATEWLTNATTSTIKVDAVDPDDAAAVFGGINTAREITVTYKPFGNAGLKLIKDKFTLTVGSPIYGKDGKLIKATLPTTGKWKDGLKNGENTDLKVSFFTFKDINNKLYSILPANTDIVKYEVILANQAAKDYLTLDGGKGALSKSDWAKLDNSLLVDDKPIVVACNTGSTVLVTKTQCDITLKVTDLWGMVTTTTISINAIPNN